MDRQNGKNNKIKQNNKKCVGEGWKGQRKCRDRAGERIGKIGIGQNKEETRGNKYRRGANGEF